MIGSLYVVNYALAPATVRLTGEVLDLHQGPLLRVEHVTSRLLGWVGAEYVEPIPGVTEIKEVSDE